MKFFSILIVIVVINAQVWQNSFNAGNYDINDNYLGGSEVLQLVSHKNKLFASVGYWQDELNIWYGGNNVNNGWSQIIRLDNSERFENLINNKNIFYSSKEIKWLKWKYNIYLERKHILIVKVLKKKEIEGFIFLIKNFHKGQNLKRLSIVEIIGFDEAIASHIDKGIDS